MVIVTKSAQKEVNENKSNGNFFSLCIQQGLLNVYFPDDNYQTIKMRTIPVKPNSKCKDVKSLIAAKFKIFDSEKYGLYLIENGVERTLNDEPKVTLI